LLLDVRQAIQDPCGLLAGRRSLNARRVKMGRLIITPEILALRAERQALDVLLLALIF
jgi:hypothetical protein